MGSKARSGALVGCWTEHLRNRQRASQVRSPLSTANSLSPLLLSQYTPAASNTTRLQPPDRALTAAYLPGASRNVALRLNTPPLVHRTLRASSHLSPAPLRAHTPSQLLLMIPRR
jgi:hypothetical protein